MRNKIMMLSVALVLSVSMILSGCGKKEATIQSSETTAVSTTPIAAVQEQLELTRGYYYDNSTGLDCFYRFNEDGSYYAKFFNGGVVDAGTYQVLDEQMDYFVDGGADENFDTKEDNTVATANQVVVVNSYLGGEPIKMAYTNDQLCDIDFGGMAHHRNMAHKADYAYNPAVDETPIIIQEFYANDSVGSMLTLNHDKTFGDTTGDTYLSGTWTLVANNTYEMNYDDFDQDGKLIVTDDGVSASLTLPDDTEIKLTKEVSAEENAVSLSVSAEEAQVGLPMSVGLRLDCKADDTCQLIVEIPSIGAELIADTGTYTVSDTYQYGFVFETAGEITGTPDYTTATLSSVNISVPYKADVAVEFNGAETPLTIDSTLTGTYSIPASAQ